MNRFIFSFCMIAFLLDLFSDATAQVAPRSYKEEIATWDKERLDSLKSATGWVNLAGLYWLKSGENPFGSDPSNALVFQHPSFPAQLGSFLLTDKEVIWKTAVGQTVLEKNKPFDQGVIFQLDSMRSLSLAYKTFRWSIIKREQLIGVRFRDLANPALDALKKSIDFLLVAIGYSRLSSFLRWCLRLPRPTYLDSRISNRIPGKFVLLLMEKHINWMLWMKESQTNTTSFLEMPPMEMTRMSRVASLIFPSPMPTVKQSLISIKHTIPLVHFLNFLPVPFPQKPIPFPSPFQREKRRYTDLPVS